MSGPSNQIKAKLAIWGAGGHALVVTDIVRQQGIYEISGYVIDKPANTSANSFCGLPLLGSWHGLLHLRTEGTTNVLFAFGDNEARMEHAKVAKDEGWTLGTAVHPTSVVTPQVRVGGGTVIAAGAIINPQSVVGDNVIVNTGAIIDHECEIHDGVHVGPGARLAGGVVVDRLAWVGIGATVIDGVRIGSGAIIGAGSVVLRDIPADVIAYGVPARVIRAKLGATRQ